jgi:hypothetical protein
MKYVLIYLFVVYQQPGGTNDVEFDDLDACQTAKSAMIAQAAKKPGADVSFPVIVCSPKGTPGKTK